MSPLTLGPIRFVRSDVAVVDGRWELLASRLLLRWQNTRDSEVFVHLVRKRENRTLVAVAKHQRGFTLIEITLVVGLMCVVAAIAVPLLVRARMAGNESSALGSMRAVGSAQSTYASSCAGGSYAPTLARLATSPVGGGDAFLDPDFNADPTVKSGYQFTLTAGPVAPGSPASCNGAAAGTSVSTYFLGGDPIGAGYGRRYFGANSSGSTYESLTPVVVTQSGLPPGATPVQ